MLDVLAHFRRDISALDRRVIIALVYTAFGLACTYYLKNTEAVAGVLYDTPLKWFGDLITNTSNNNLAGLAWWVTLVTTVYVVGPFLIIRFGWKANVRDFGLLPRMEPGFWKLLAACTAVMLPLVYLMSLTGGFAAKYPFLRIYNGEPYIGRTLLIWELIYFIQFFGLEFFFRGFLVHSLKRSLGLYSIFIMTVPYCMIHFGKPPAETLAAIAAGIFLGWLSYRNGSIWLGMVLHCTVAFSMDILALYNKGLVF
ncbi:MAG: CPBP family intramembrane metalloprotease [Acidobacteria bacterium]|nr:CPBP family intramembrane metalloprotease [Acidobacteriota bacterium]